MNLHQIRNPNTPQYFTSFRHRHDLMRIFVYSAKHRIRY
jgi:hypothetical protein